MSDNPDSITEENSKKSDNNAIENSIKSNAHKLKPYIPLCISVLIMFVIFKYWDSAINFIGLFISAASGLIIGIIIAFLVNIIMTTYEKGINKLFRGKLKHSILRAIGITTSMLTMLLIIFGVIKIVIPELINSISLMITALTDNVPKMLKELKNNKYVGKYAANLLNSMPSSKDIETTVQGLGR